MEKLNSEMKNKKVESRVQGVGSHIFFFLVKPLKIIYFILKKYPLRF